MAVSMNVDYTRQLYTGLSTDDWGDVEFKAGDVAYIMDQSQCWIFDGSTMHQLPDLGGGGGVDFSDIAQNKDRHNIGYMFDSIQNGRWDYVEFSVISGTTPVVIEFDHAPIGWLCYPKNEDAALTAASNVNTRLSYSIKNDPDSGGSQASLWNVVRTKIATGTNATGTVYFQGVGSATLVNNTLSMTITNPSSTTGAPFAFNTPYIMFYWW